MKYLTNFRPAMLPVIRDTLREMEDKDSEYFFVYPHPMPPDFEYWNTYNYDAAVKQGYYCIAVLPATSEDTINKFWRIYGERRNRMDRYTGQRIQD